MFNRGKVRESGSRPNENVRPAADVLAFFHPDLRATLASLHGAPQLIAEATVQLLPFGSRAALETVNPPLAIARRAVDQELGQPLTLTAFAYVVIAAAAAAMSDHGYNEDRPTLK